MKFGIRKPSIKRRIAARTSLKRIIRHKVGIKAPKGYGLLTNPKRATYNRIYNKTTISVDKLLKTNKKNINTGGSCFFPFFFIILFVFLLIA